MCADLEVGRKCGTSGKKVWRHVDGGAGLKWEGSVGQVGRKCGTSGKVGDIGGDAMGSWRRDQLSLKPYPQIPLHAKTCLRT